MSMEVIREKLETMQRELNRPSRPSKFLLDSLFLIPLSKVSSIFLDQICKTFFIQRIVFHSLTQISCLVVVPSGYEVSNSVLVVRISQSSLFVFLRVSEAFRVYFWTFPTISTKFSADFRVNKHSQGGKQDSRFCELIRCLCCCSGFF